MKILTYTILAILFTTGVLSQSDANDTTETTPSPTTESTTITTSETTQTSETTTTPSVPTTTSSITSTPTAAPTTVPPTTVPPTTTVSPTTSEAPPTSTKGPKPTPDECVWNVTQDGVTCIRAELKAIFTIPIEGRVEYIVLTNNASDNQSNCNLSNDTQKLVLTDLSYSLTMLFVKEDDKIYVNETTLEYTLPEGPGKVSSDSKIFSVKAGNSYMCRSQINLQLGNVTMEVYDVHIQAFGVRNNTNFGSAEECEADDKVSDAVPIAVGCALAALIIIVLIAYLVGRRRSRQRGYQSV